MENIRKYILQAVCVLSLAVIATGCDAFGEDNSGFTPETPQLSIQADEIINIERTETRLVIPVTSNLPWRASADVGWITFEVPNGLQSGDCVLIVSGNSTRDPRTATIKIWITEESVKSFTIVQAETVPGDNATDYYVKTTGTADADGLSWANATTFEKALSLAIIGDNVHVAAGTYYPWKEVSGGSATNVSDRTFELNSNIRIIGGYPTDAQEGAVYDPKANETILSGAIPEGSAYHVMVVTAPADPDITLEVKGVTITGGVSNTASSAMSINGNSVNRNQAAALVVSAGVVDFVDCTFKGNTSTANGNMWLTGGSDVSFENCVISGNICNANGAAIFNTGSTLYMNNCTLDSNLAAGVGGAVYSYNTTAKSYSYIYNSTFTGNMVNSGNLQATRRGAAIYARENSEMVVVNCTFTGNKGGNGGAISAYGSATATCKLDIINCTITGNIAQTSGGGVDIANTSATVKLYNTIVSGNTAAVTANSDFFTDGGSSFAERKSYVDGSNVYDATGGLVSSAFDPVTMLGTLSDNGGKTSTIALTGTDNPAVNNGMTASDLSNLGLGYTPVISADVITFDQRGVSRQGKTAIGAWVSE